jgi:hypothetical protein
VKGAEEIAGRHGFRADLEQETPLARAGGARSTAATYASASAPYFLAAVASRQASPVIAELYASVL